MSPQPRTVRVALFRDIFVWYGNWSSCLTETGRKCPKITSSHQRARIPLQMAARIWPITLNSRGVYFRIDCSYPVRNSSKSWAEILSGRFSGALLSLLSLISSCKLVWSFKPLSHFLTSRRIETLHSHGEFICNECSRIPCIRDSCTESIPYNE